MGIRRIPIKGGGGWGPYFPQPGSGSFPKPQQPNPLSVFLSTFGNAMMPVLQQNYLGDMEDRRWRERQQLEQDWRTQQEEREYQRRLEMERQKHEWDVEADAAKAEAARMPLQNFSGAIPRMQEAIGGGLDHRSSEFCRPTDGFGSPGSDCASFQKCQPALLDEQGAELQTLGLCV